MLNLFNTARYITPILVLILSGCANTGDTATQIGLNLSTATGQALGTLTARALGH